MKINWKVRLANKAFWVSAISALLLLVQVILAAFGITIDIGDIGNKIIAIVNALFAFLTVIGVVNDPTTAGVISDSTQAMTYETPKKSI